APRGDVVRHLLDPRPQPEGVHEQKHPRPAAIGHHQVRVGDAVLGRHVHHALAHALSLHSLDHRLCHQTYRSASSTFPSASPLSTRRWAAAISVSGNRAAIGWVSALSVSRRVMWLAAAGRAWAGLGEAWAAGRAEV